MDWLLPIFHKLAKKPVAEYIRLRQNNKTKSQSIKLLDLPDDLEYIDDSCLLAFMKMYRRDKY